MILHALSCRLDSELIQQKEFSTSHDDFECDSRVMPFKSEDTLAEWLRRRPAKALCSHAWVQIPQVSFFRQTQPESRDTRLEYSNTPILPRPSPYSISLASSTSHVRTHFFIFLAEHCYSLVGVVIHHA
jgi:hypothetical protein